MVLILFNFVATLIGMKAKLELSYYGLLAHACYAISFIGGFYCYIILDYFLTAGTRGGIENDNLVEEQRANTGLPDSLVLFLVSIPFFGLFMMGIYSMVLLFKVDAELDARAEAEGEGNVQ